MLPRDGAAVATEAFEHRVGWEKSSDAEKSAVVATVKLQSVNESYLRS